MNRIKCEIAYDGTHFSGYQIQPNGRTVQEELQTVLAKIHKGTAVKVAASGRTDAGVHAVGQVIHFDTPLALPADKWPTALNSRLPFDISVKKAELAPEGFHARFSTAGKEYRYKIYQDARRDPFKRSTALHYPYKLDVAAMERGASYMLGTHDFTSFCSARTEVVDKVRTVKRIDIVCNNKDIELRFTGDGFLYNMVRIMTGTLLEIGIGKRTPEDVKGMLLGKDRSLAGKTAGAEGLYLWKVFYSN